MVYSVLPSIFLKVASPITIAKAGTTASTKADPAQNRDGRKRQRTPSVDRDTPPEKRAHNVDERANADSI